MPHEGSGASELASISEFQALQDGWGDFCFKEHGVTRCYVCRKPGRALYPFGLYDDMTREFDLLFGQEDVGEEEIQIREAQIEPFPFLDLPFEIRQLVYGQIVEPFRDKDGSIYMHMGPPNDETKAHPIRKQYALVFYGDTRIDRQIDDSPYEDGDEHLHVEYEDFQAIWCLPGVCRQIREEFASIFWPHVNLTCPVIVCVPNGEIGHIEEFLKHRQQAVKSLKYLSWGLMLDRNNAEAQQDLERLFTVAHKHFDIDGLMFNILVDGGVANQLLENPDLPWIQIFRSIKKELWLDDDLSPTIRDQLYELLNPKLLPEQTPTVMDRYLLVREV